MPVPERDLRIVRELARRKAELASLPVQKQTFEMWRRLNCLEPVRPMVFINELPWHELGPEIQSQSTDPSCRWIESALRGELYQWDHMRWDMVIEPVFYTPFAYRDTGFGLQAELDRSPQALGAAAFKPILNGEKDVEKIQLPTIAPDWETTERTYQQACEILDGVLEVRKRGVAHMWSAPWDILIRWYGIQKLFTDMIERPALVHAAIGRMTDALLAQLDGLEAHGLLSVSNGNHRVGSGGLGITDELPPPDYDPGRVRPRDQWGTSTGQIFSAVSPAMHEEFCLRYEMCWLERFGLNAYGCCEPLHHKIGILRGVPRLRRISVSPWANLEKAAEEIGADYVFSLKPNPALLAADRWDLDAARQTLRASLEIIRGCRVEVILKDLHTLRNQPKRLSEWAGMAAQVVEEFT
jgi:hypothetical protein